MAAYPKITFIAEGGYGIIYGNFSQLENEPNVITKFFNSYEGAQDEIVMHKNLFGIFIQGTDKVPVYPKLTTIIGIGIPKKINGVNIRGIQYPDYKYNCIKNGPEYAVVKMPFLGKNLWGDDYGSGNGHTGLTFDAYMTILEIFVFFHTTAVHGDMKMDNILWDQASARAGIIDLGLTNQFRKGYVPWSKRSRPDPYFPWPPEFWTDTTRSGSSRDKYSSHYISYPANQTYSPPGAETFWNSNPGSVRMLKTVYDDYLVNVDNTKCLTMGVTADLYGLGKTLVNSIRQISQVERNKPYLVGYSPNGDDIQYRYADIMRNLQLLFTNLHPKLRPLDYTVVRYFRILNTEFLPNAGNRTIINVNGNPYFSVRFLNKAYDAIDITGQQNVDNAKVGNRVVMAYGQPGSPITIEQKKENMIIFSYLITKKYDQLKVYFQTQGVDTRYTKLIYNNVLQDAVAYFNNESLKQKKTLQDLGIVALPAVAAPEVTPPRANPVQAGYQPFAQAHFGGGGAAAQAQRQADANARGAAAAAARQRDQEAAYIAMAAAAAATARAAAAAAAAGRARAPGAAGTARGPLTKDQILTYQRQGIPLFKWRNGKIYEEPEEGRYATNPAAHNTEQERAHIDAEAVLEQINIAQKRYLKDQEIRDKVKLQYTLRAEYEELDKQGKKNEYTKEKRGQIVAQIGRLELDIKEIRKIFAEEEIRILTERISLNRNTPEKLEELKERLETLQQQLADIQRGGFTSEEQLQNRKNNFLLTTRNKGIERIQNTKNIFSEKKLLNSLKSHISLEQQTEGNFLETFIQYYINGLQKKLTRINGTAKNIRNSKNSMKSVKSVNSMNSMKTMKNRGIKLNNTLPKVTQGSMYSDYQYELIENQLAIGEASGRLNILYQYYLRALPNKKDIFSRLLKISLGAEESLRISKYLQSGNLSELEKYLTDHSEQGAYIKNEKERVFNELGIRLVTEYYFAFEDDAERYVFLHTLFSSIPDTQKEIQDLAQKFIKTKAGSNPFA
uniref:Protein kinase domain-containing protein n=1 Tax=viral metagenome TaxID=1070528 RepID=A0A6C0AN82_9ZZZZ